MAQTPLSFGAKSRNLSPSLTERSAKLQREILRLRSAPLRMTTDESARVKYLLSRRSFRISIGRRSFTHGNCADGIRRFSTIPPSANTHESFSMTRKNCSNEFVRRDY